MHPELVDVIVESVRRRVGQGDCPTEPAQSVETLEDCVLTLAHRLTAPRPSPTPATAGTPEPFAWTVGITGTREFLDVWPHPEFCGESSEKLARTRAAWCNANWSEQGKSFEAIPLYCEPLALDAIQTETRTPEAVKDAWGDVEQLAIDAGVDSRAWIAAVARFWRIANLASESVPASAPAREATLDALARFVDFLINPSLPGEITPVYVEEWLRDNLAAFRALPTASPLDAIQTEREKIHGVTWILIRDGMVLLERCPKKAAVLGVGEWFIPGGKVEGDETPEQTLQREISEEWPDVQLSGWSPLPIIEGSAIPPGPRGLFLMRPFVITASGYYPDRSADGVELRWTPVADALASPVPQVRMMIAAALSSGGAPLRDETPEAKPAIPSPTREDHSNG